MSKKPTVIKSFSALNRAFPVRDFPCVNMTIVSGGKRGCKFDSSLACNLHEDKEFVCPISKYVPNISV